MRATRLSKLWLKALRTDSNTIGSVPLNITKLVGQTANMIEIRDTNDTTVLWSIGPDGGAVAAGGATQIQQVSIAIPSADITSTAAGKLGHAQGQILVAAPGAGKAIEFVSATLSYTFSVAAYTAGGNLTINLGGGGAALTGLISAANSIGAGANKVVGFVPLSTVGIALAENTGLNLVSSAAFTQPGTAAGSAKVFLSYKVHTL